MSRSKEMQRVNRLVTKYRRLFGLNGVTGWTIYVSMKKEGELKSDSGGALSEGAPIAGQCDASPAYRNAYIDIDWQYVKKSSDEELDDLVRHEMLHIVTSPVFTFVNDLIATTPRSGRQRLYKALSQVNESVTTDLEQILKCRPGA